MRQITVFTSNGVGQPITEEHEPERQIRRVLKAAQAMFRTNGYVLTKTMTELHSEWIFGSAEALALKQELERLETLL